MDRPVGKVPKTQTRSCICYFKGCPRVNSCTHAPTPALPRSALHPVSCWHRLAPHFMAQGFLDTMHTDAAVYVFSKLRGSRVPLNPATDKHLLSGARTRELWRVGGAPGQG